MEIYTRADFQQDFPDDRACLEWLRAYRYPEGILCRVCHKITNHYLVESRKSYSCQVCGHHLHPTAGTIFHKSSTPLTQWFYSVYLMVRTPGGISAKQLQRELGVTYKTAWRMFKLIDSQLRSDRGLFSSQENSKPLTTSVQKPTRSKRQASPSSAPSSSP